MTRRLFALISALGLVGGWPAAAGASGPADLYYERSLMGAANARCRLFAPDIAAALNASARQARGAALRAGADPAALDTLQARADQRAAATPCRSPDLGVAAGRVKAAFAGYAHLNTMSFPGAYATWRADRGQAGAATAAWRLSEAARGPSGPLILGIAATADGMEALTAVAGWPGALAASSARLVVRDPAKAPRPYLDPRRKDLAGQTPPRSVTVAFLASARDFAAPELLPPGATAGAAFRFSTAAAAALQGLDPREAVVLELVYPTRNGERVEDVALEVGDFAAGVAFLSAGRS
jgi:hypothetical protein